MKDFLIVANIKNNLLVKDIITYLEQIKEYDGNNLVICPPSIYIPYFLKNKFDVGIQNVCHEICTGEILPIQASDMGIKYTIVGHSDRRILLNESEIDINKKVQDSVNNGLKVILCVGETLEEKSMMKTTRVLNRQLQSGLRNVKNFENIIIAYEPIWAIGTGKTPNNQDIKDAVTYIKEVVSSISGYNDIHVIYGGSVDLENIELLKKIPNLNGVLVGKSSLDADKLIELTKK